MIHCSNCVVTRWWLFWVPWGMAEAGQGPVGHLPAHCCRASLCPSCFSLLGCFPWFSLFAQWSGAAVCCQLSSSHGTRGRSLKLEEQPQFPPHHALPPHACLPSPPLLPHSSPFTDRAGSKAHALVSCSVPSLFSVLFLQISSLLYSFPHLLFG